MMKTYHFPIGLSDHSVDHLAATSAIAMGASVIEKHVTIDRNDGAIDSKFSIPIDEMEAFCRLMKNAYALIGSPTYTSSSPRKNYRSLYVVNEIKKGETFTHEHVKSIRPGHGIAPKHLNDVIGQVATQDVPKATPFSWSYVGKRLKPLEGNNNESH